MAAAIQTLEQRIQQLGIEAEARGLTDAQRAREAGCKAMKRKSKYNGEGMFRTFKLEYTMWEKVNQINNIPDEDFKKFAVLSAFTGKAADMVRCLGPKLDKYCQDISARGRISHGKSGICPKKTKC